jgi:hypothetical protein
MAARSPGLFTRPLTVCVGITFLVHVVTYLLNTQLPLRVLGLGGRHVQIGWLFAMNTGVAMLLRPQVGGWVRLHHRLPAHPASRVRSSRPDPGLASGPGRGRGRQSAAGRAAHRGDARRRRRAARQRQLAWAWPSALPSWRYWFTPNELGRARVGVVVRVIRQSGEDGNALTLEQLPP